MQATEVSHWLVNCVDRTRQSAELLMPTDALPGAGWVGLIFLAIAVFVGIYAAKYAKGLFTALLGGAGFLVGARVAENMQFHHILGGVIGLAVVAALIYFTFRLWVGVAVAALVAAIGLFAYGYDSVWPEFLNYDHNTRLTSVDGGPYQLPSASEQQSFQNPSPLGYMKGFYEHFSEEYPPIALNSKLLVAVCAIVGFVFGAFATRWALIVSAAILATTLLVASLGTFAEGYAAPGWERQLAAHPKVALGFVAVCAVLSMLVQIRMTQPRTAPQKQAEEPKH